MSWLIRSSSLARIVATHVHALQRQATGLAGPRSLRRARAGMLRVITVVAGH
jgi:glyceraldehyde-3-phosphate dehydrogenase/erythrose-4-phosphate dehydrogenase